MENNVLSSRAVFVKQSLMSTFGLNEQDIHVEFRTDRDKYNKDGYSDSGDGYIWVVVYYTHTLGIKIDEDLITPYSIPPWRLVYALWNGKTFEGELKKDNPLKGKNPFAAFLNYIKTLPSPKMWSR